MTGKNGETKLFLIPRLGSEIRVKGIATLNKFSVELRKYSGTFNLQTHLEPISEEDGSLEEIRCSVESAQNVILQFGHERMNRLKQKAYKL